MSKRGLGFNDFEDEILCRAYLLHTTDGEVGAYQTSEMMWKKVQSAYNHEAVDKKRLIRRTVKSLKSRWLKISPACVLYGSCLLSVEARNQSGSNEVESIKQAMELYVMKEPFGKKFTYMHAWEILKAYPKWAMPDNSQRDNESSHMDDETPGSTTVGGDSEDSTPQNDVRAGFDRRGLGIKATKARWKLHHEKDPMWEEMMKNSSKTHELLEKQLHSIDSTHQAKMLIEQQKLDIKKEKYACKQRQMDMRAAEIEAEILSKNLANMTPFSKAYWSRKKQAVVDGMTMRSRASRSLNFSEDGSGGSNVGGDFSQNDYNSQYNDGQRNEEYYYPNMNDVNDTYGGENENERNNVGGTSQNDSWRQE